MKKDISGFTLIELMVSVTVILVLAGIGSVSINGFIMSRKIKSAKNEVVSQIKLARNLAITNQLPDGSVDLSYVKVSIVDKLLTTTGVVIDGGTAMSYSDSPYFSKNLEIGVSNSVLFGFASNTGRLTDGNGVLIDGPVIVSITGDSFNINSLGVVSE